MLDRVRMAGSEHGDPERASWMAATTPVDESMRGSGQSSATGRAVCPPRS
jgi:hypothetical protein